MDSHFARPIWYSDSQLQNNPWNRKSISMNRWRRESAATNRCQLGMHLGVWVRIVQATARIRQWHCVIRVGSKRQLFFCSSALLEYLVENSKAKPSWNNSYLSKIILTQQKTVLISDVYGSSIYPLSISSYQFQVSESSSILKPLRVLRFDRVWEDNKFSRLYLLRRREIHMASNRTVLAQFLATTTFNCRFR